MNASETPELTEMNVCVTSRYPHVYIFVKIGFLHGNRSYCGIFTQLHLAEYVNCGVTRYWNRIVGFRWLRYCFAFATKTSAVGFWY